MDYLRENDAKYFKNEKCEFYPCHDLDDEAGELNCLFCYCPMYFIECLGEPLYIVAGGREIKDCSECMFPHRAESYPAMMEYLVMVLKGVAA